MSLIARALTLASYAVHPQLSAERLAFLRGSILQLQFLVMGSSASLPLVTIRSRTRKETSLWRAALALLDAFYCFLVRYGTWRAGESAVPTVMTPARPPARSNRPNMAFHTLC